MPYIAHVNNVFQGNSSDKIFKILIIKGFVNNRKTDIIIDTGSAENIVTQDYANKIRKNSNTVFLLAAGGHKLPVLGSTRLNVKIKNFTTTVKALVIEQSPKPLILGMNFLLKHQSNINFQDCSITLNPNKSNSTRIFFNKSFVDEPWKTINTVTFNNYLDDIQLAESKNYNKLVILSDVEIQPQETVVIKLEIDKLSDSVANKPCEFKLHDAFFVKHKLIPIKGVSSHNGKWKIKIKSRNPITTRLFAGTSIGHFYEVQPGNNYNFIGTLDVCENPAVESHDINTELTATQQHAVKNLIQEYKDIFATSFSEIGFTDFVQHSIITEDAVPIQSRPYKVSHKERQIIQNQIDEMLRYNIIRPSNSPWSSPVVLIKKKDNTFRFCVDYRKLNAVTKKDSYPIPLIPDLLSYLSGSKYFTSLDLLSGYFQIGVKEDHREKTCFVSPDGLYEFNVMPFGLTNAPRTFQNMINKIFSGLLFKEILVYLDDVLIFSKTFEEHIHSLRNVFARLRKYGLTLKPSKCRYAKTEITVLGHTVNSYGITPDDTKIEAISNFPVPNTVKKVQSFVGMCSFFRKYIENFARIAKPLYEITKPSASFTWGIDQQEAFETLKNKLLSAPVLRHFDPELETELRIDASREGLGAVLLQNFKGETHPIAYISRGLTKAEKNYGVTELEALTAIWALIQLRPYVFGKHIKIVTDHHALCWIQKIKDITGRLARWSIKLQDFDYTVVHKNGAAHKDADCLSRNPCRQATEFDEVQADFVPTFTVVSENIAELQRKDPLLEKIFLALENQDNVTLSIGERQKAKSYKLIDNVLYKKNANLTGEFNLLVIPNSLKHEILYDHHDSPLAGHLGISKTYSKIASRFYWNDLFRDVKRYVNGCKTCQARKGSNKKPPGLLHPICIGIPFEKIGIDLITPIKRSRDGKNTIVVVTDYATRYSETKALSSGKAEPVAQFLLEQVICRHGSPRYIISDRGKVFQSQLVTELLKIMGTNSRYTSGYYPQTNGLTERLNKTIIDMLSKYVSTDQSDWNLYLPHVTFAYNTSIQDSTKMSPFMLMYGREARLPTEAHLNSPVELNNIVELRDRTLAARHQAVLNIQAHQAKNKAYYDASHRILDFEDGQQVKVFTPVRKVGKSEKLLLKWHGPYIIKQKISEVDYLIKKGTTPNAKEDIVHVSRILPFHDPWLNREMADEQIPDTPETLNDTTIIDEAHDEQQALNN